MTPKQLAIWWNVNLPIDKWYREKFKIRLFSEEHLNLSLFDIKVAWEEDKLYNSLQEKKQKEEKLKKEGWLKEDEANLIAKFLEQQ